MPTPESLNNLRGAIIGALDLIEGRGTKRQYLRANMIAAATYKCINEINDLDNGIKGDSQVKHHPRPDLERNVVRGLGGILRITADVLKN